MQIKSVHSSAQARLALAPPMQWDWLFLDINIADDGDHLLFEQICANEWVHRTILISAEPSYALVHKALLAGVRGFISKSIDPSEFLASFEQVISGLIYVPPEFQSQIDGHFLNQESLTNLSPRLLQVQEMLFKGYPNKLIARQLNLSLHTVKEYVSLVLSRHSVSNRLELVIKQQAA